MSTGLIAILRGLTPPEAPGIGEALYGAGFRRLEVPLNSPAPDVSIRRLRATVPPDCRVGAGTVLTQEAVRRCAESGAQMIVCPHTDVEVIQECCRLGLDCYPGAATPTEALRAVAAGASALKLFPAVQIGTAGMQAWRSVLPPTVEMVPVGGVDESTLPEWLAAGADGAGLGGALYRPGDSAHDVIRRATRMMEIWAESSL